VDHDDRVACGHMLSTSIKSLFNNLALHLVNMEANRPKGSAALRRYPLLTIPYLKRSSSAFKQPQSSSSFNLTGSGQDL